MGTENDFRKVVRIGDAPFYTGKSFMAVFVEIEYRAGELSIHGVEGPLASGNAKGACGQIDMHMDGEYLDSLRYAKGWTREKVVELLFVWKRWHLNKLKAGSPRQEEFLRRNPELVKATYPESHYDKALKVLGEAGLNPDAEYLHDGKPYEYGKAWLFETVPNDVIEWLKGLPDSDREPAWV